ncbi:hypothetical protein [Pseudoduganella namucuonensis]|uniref:hypothetical protein n=1 Tax=Pseudoduganella namucuonensis TaxID=1035707 RepID=UPI0011602582|nr:hypothetical protein [Pseudoduganella namucuonensis]
MMTNISRERLPRRPSQTGKTETKRMVILVGQGTYTKHFITLDFTEVNRSFPKNLVTIQQTGIV